MRTRTKPVPDCAAPAREPAAHWRSDEFVLGQLDDPVEVEVCDRQRGAATLGWERLGKDVAQSQAGPVVE
ncbi:MAG: hypothetical protein IZT58_03310 [Actinobacteria bacterium]|nr:hypothetical protein [Actinomycetota bacterium]